MTHLKSRFARFFPPMVAVLALGTSVGYTAHQYMSGGCCHPGSPCCYPGSPCCSGHAAPSGHAGAQGPLAMK